MTVFLIVLHVLVCVFLILFVLLQPGARGGVGAAFGGAGGQTVFGGRGANTFLAKLTAAAAVIFMVTSISLSFFVSRTKSVMPPPKPSTSAAVPADDAKDGDKAADKDADKGADKDADKDADKAADKGAEKAADPAPVGDAPPPPSLPAPQE